MAWWDEMFAAPGWQSVQLSWEGADDADQEVDQLERALGLHARDRVLDVPCGTGRIARRLVDRGYDAVGIDATAAFLDVARDAGVPAIRADMRTTTVRPGAFDAVVCMWGSFGYFDEAGNAAQARAAASALVAGGCFLIDTFAADTVLAAFESAASWAVGGTDVEEVRAYDASTRRIETTWTFTRGDDREERTTSVRLYAVEELTDLLSSVGFATFRALDGELQPFAPGAERLWLVATMPD
jgi:SAM-dependent methyltransferase